MSNDREVKKEKDDDRRQQKESLDYIAICLTIKKKNIIISK